MRAIIQRVKKASVAIENEIYSQIESGYLVLLGINQKDCHDDRDYIIDKILNLRIFPDENGKANISIVQNEYEILVVSQFTLYGDARKGRRPSFSDSARPEHAKLIYVDFIDKLKSRYSEILVNGNDKIKTGVFQEMMDVNLINEGPFTMLLDSERRF